ncbi:hypothetical protein DRQ33_03535 [bacterium]|nr:MAG: hypothetical protein DRQ33_03535 [bacterium]
MAKVQPHILVVDDEESICQLLEIMLTEEGYWVNTAQDYDEAMKRLSNESYDVIIAAIMMPDVDGLTLLKDIKKLDNDMPVILITAYASLGSAVEALRRGAFDYITKPFQMDQIRFAVKRALDTRNLRKENKILRQALRIESDLSNFVGTSKAINNIRELVKRIAPTESTVLITGESGTGKELIARAIHQLSDRSNGPFVTINCAALPETLLESELFGYVKGAFTGADKDKDGLFKTADGGTFFLDEVAETSLKIQAKLLRLMETNEFTPLGATQPINADVRLIAATNKDLKKMVETNEFRGDLYYRLNVIHIDIPPLREHREDIIPIAEHFLEKLARRTGKEVPNISPESAEILNNSDWEGNVRELENVLERAMLVLERDTILPEHLPDYIKKSAQEREKEKQTEQPSGMMQKAASQLGILSLEEIEKAYIFWALVQADGNKSEAARKLGIDLSTLYRKIEKYGLKDYLPEK